MCGIVGVASKRPQINRSWLTIGRDMLSHRGPDDAGEWWSADGLVGFAHRRLSIMDLSAAGHQPMHDSSGSLSIVFNGEIYNFKDLRKELVASGHGFRSNSDTEVVLEAYRRWGVDCLKRFNGMFAFALYDARQKTLFLARDRVGEKPLYYHQKNETFRFGSELKALLADSTLPRKIDHEALDCYLAMGYVPGEGCMLSGFNKLPPAHALLFSLQTSQTRIWRYWDLPELSPTSDSIGKDFLLDELENLLEDAVRRQMVADVPVGILLSGGVDSSLITAMAVRSSSQVQTFTVGFPGHGKLDETKHALLIARHFRTSHTVLMADDISPDILVNLAHQFDEPIADSSMIPTFLVSKLVRQHCAVALGGDGGDELFGGYGHYSRLLWFQQRLSFIPYKFRKQIAAAAELFLPVGFKGRNWLQGINLDLNSGTLLPQLFFDPTARKRLMSEKLNWPLVAEHIIQGRMPRHMDLIQTATRIDFKNYLAEDILAKVDRASMLNSLEVRAPLLDFRLIEFAFGKVPSNMKLIGRDKKILLKRLAARVLPPEFDQQRKQGFAVPLNQWLKGGKFRDFFNAVLRDKDSIFDASTIDGLLQGQDGGRSNSERLFSLVLFELWRRAYKVDL